MDSTDFVLRDSEATSQIKRLEPSAHQHSSTPKRLSASIVLSLLLHGGAIAAVAGIFNEFSNATAIQSSTVITANLVTEASIRTNTDVSIDDVSELEIPIESENSAGEIPVEKPVDELNREQDPSEQPAIKTIRQESIATNVESSKQTPKDETSDTELETVEFPEIPTGKLARNMSQSEESKAETTSEKKTTPEPDKKPTVSNTTKAIETEVDAVAIDNFEQSDAPSSESTLANEQPIVLAKADRSIINGVERRRDATPANGNTKPKYPRVAIRKGYEGSVVLHVTVSSSGNVKDIVVGTGSGYRSLDISAMNTVKRWRFKPAIENGEAVESKTEIPVVFRLIDAES